MSKAEKVENVQFNKRSLGQWKRWYGCVPRALESAIEEKLPGVVLEQFRRTREQDNAALMQEVIPHLKQGVALDVIQNQVIPQLAEKYEQVDNKRLIDMVRAVRRLPSQAHSVLHTLHVETGIISHQDMIAQMKDGNKILLHSQDQVGRPHLCHITFTPRGGFISVSDGGAKVLLKKDEHHVVTLITKKNG